MAVNVKFMLKHCFPTKPVPLGEGVFFNSASSKAFEGYNEG